MKKTRIIIPLLFFATCLFQTVNASTTLINSDVDIVTDFNEDEIYNSFNEVDEIVSYINSNEAVSYSDVMATNLAISNLNNSVAIASNGLGNNGQPPLMSPFWWGCLTGPIGIVVVAVTTENDKDQIKKAAWGCALPTGCTAISYIAYFALYATAYGYSY